MRLVMAEKPSVAQDLARVMDPGAKSVRHEVDHAEQVKLLPPKGQPPTAKRVLRGCPRGQA